MRTIQPRLDRHTVICEAIEDAIQAPEAKINQATTLLRRLGYEAVAGCSIQEPAMIARELSYSSAWHNAGEIILAASITDVRSDFRERIGSPTIREVALWQHPAGQQCENISRLVIPTGSDTEDSLELEVLQWREIGNVYGNPQRAA